MRFANIVEAIGHTPLVELQRFSPRPGVRLFAKLEGHNPSGSVKDRIARTLIEDAEQTGKIGPDTILLEPTSGNTGIGLAMISQVKGYRLKVVMPDNVSLERRQLLELFGAEVELTDGAQGSNGSIARAKELAEDPKYHLLYQYGNPANPRAHYETTAPEIIADLPEVDVFVAGLGTGGTLMGVGRRLKEHNPKIQLDLSTLDRKIVVRNEDALVATRELVRREGVFAGLSGGAALAVALRVAGQMQHGTIVVLLADGGWKYLSTGLYSASDLDATVGIRGRNMW